MSEHEAYDVGGIALRCSCGDWSALYRNSLGRPAHELHREHVEKTAAASPGDGPLARPPGQ